MTIRSTICTLSLIAAATLSACSGSSRFGIHEGADTASAERTEAFEQNGRTIRYTPAPFLDASDVESYYPSSSATGSPALGLVLTEDGTATMLEWSKAHVGDYVVFTLDGKAISAPMLMSSIGRHIIVTGSDDSSSWIAELRDALKQAGATEVESVRQSSSDAEIPGFQLYMARTEPTETYWCEIDLHQAPTLWMSLQPLLTDEHVGSAIRTRDENGNPAIRLTLTDTGSEIMRSRAVDYVDRYLIVTWEGRAVMAPYAVTPLGSKLMVTGPGLDPDLPDNWIDQILKKHSG